MRRRFRLAVATVVSAVVLAALGTYVYLRQSLPTVDGTVRVTGLTAPVDIIRDADAITHVFASTRLDALYGLGYAHAQDRLWQMEFQRRIGLGRLSEVFGATTVPTDRFLRTLGINRAARSAWQSLSDDARRQIDAYVAGVNAFIATHHGSGLPPEFTLLRFAPSPWTGVDVLAWVKMMAWDLSRNYSTELFRHDVISKLGAARAAELMPPYPPEALNMLTEADMPWLRPVDRPATATRQAAGLAGVDRLWSPLFAGTLENDSVLTASGDRALGSNNWVVDGALTASGKPLLANDPHLGAQIPSLWYLAHLSAGDFDVVGATLPGTPAIAIGRNRYIAWGETNAAVDVQDLYRERLDPTGRFAEFRGVQEPVTTLAEHIDVKGGAPIDLAVRITRHGPLISDAINANNAASSRVPKPAPLEPLAFRWTALDAGDTTISAFLRLNDAHDWREFTDALREFVVPSQNFVYADVNGHIGFYAPGRIPVRSSGDGGTPADGWSGASEWVEWVPFDQLPHTFDPPEHFIVTANHRPVPAAYPYEWHGEWTDPYRAQRITDLIRARSKLTVDDFASMQRDTVSLHARALLPTLVSHVQPRTSEDARALQIVREWNGDAGGDQAGAAIFEAWVFELLDQVAGDELGVALINDYRALDRTSYVARFLANILAVRDSPWCDDVRTAARESCDDDVAAALHAATLRLTRLMGGAMERWRWDAVHRAVFAHPALDSVAALRPIVSRTIPHGGDWSTVNVGPVFGARPFEQHSVPGYRQIVDLSPANASRFLDAVGESGHPLSKHYADWLSDWAAGRYKPMRMDRQAIEPGAIGRLRLVP